MNKILAASLAKQQAQSTLGVERILENKLERISSLPDFSQIWDLRALGLEPVRYLQDASTEARQRVRQALAIARLQEAWFIEKAGMSYAAKMSLLSESINEQKLYSLFASEEATHFHFIDQTLGSARPQGQDPFIALLNEMISTAERRPLIFMIQVVLEGWGIQHYAMMSKTCQEPALKACLQQILADEAAHHGSGLSLFEETALSTPERQQILEFMSRFLQMVAIGPATVMSVLQTELGEFNASQRAQVLEQLNALADTQGKLNLLRDYMLKAQAQQIVSALDERKAFMPSL